MHHLSDILRCVAFWNIVKALNGFLVIQKQMTLEVNYYGLLADSVDTSLATLLYSCTTDAVLNEVRDQ